ncbi:AEC family transporter [Bifidobacterium vespertilionis]|uniref:Permease n=1 Tax=Bifidobacterium vespertilionis TaxID=2562524 RepID=A0A5J5E709_9BIFI|nr:AEC family transporter [Bifidobacterium vespertilionis]KAA8821664.1 permease [Bifidobacterium vespertilionis]KAA8824744.1 permease [Bifidobacterium vespertilionis]
MGQFGIVVGQLVGFLIMLLVGYGCVRLKFYGTVALNGMCALLLNVLIPVLVFSNAVDGTDRADLEANWGVMLLTAMMYGLLALTFFLVAWLLRLRAERGRIFQAALIFGNAGFLGIPLIMALFPQQGAIYVALMSIVDQGILWTYGVFLCEPIPSGGGETPAKPSLGARAAGLLRRFANPAFIGIMIALALILAGVRIPRIILTPLHTIGGMATPMSLIYLGGLFATTRWWNVLKRYELYAGLAAKMLLFPVAFHALLTMGPLAAVLPVTHDMVTMICLISGLPTMTTIAMFSGRRNNMPEYATGFVLVSTLFSLVSLAVVSSVIM